MAICRIVNSSVRLYFIMARRVTIMIDDDLDKKLRSIQAKAIQSTTISVSFSKVINEILRKQLK